MNCQEFANRVAGNEQQASEEKAVTALIPLLIPILLQLPCLKGLTSQEQHAWVQEHPRQSISAAAKELREKDPSISRKEARHQARRMWEEQSKLTEEEASSLVNSI